MFYMVICKWKLVFSDLVITVNHKICYKYDLKKFLLSKINIMKNAAKYSHICLK